jgi:hypothetical protein
MFAIFMDGTTPVVVRLSDTMTSFSIFLGWQLASAQSVPDTPLSASHFHAKYPALVLFINSSSGWSLLSFFRPATPIHPLSIRLTNSLLPFALTQSLHFH